MNVKAELVEAVKAHALAHYNDGGWDVIVECWDDEQIAERIGQARTVKGALAKFATLVDVWSDRQADAAQYDEPAPGPEPEPWRPCCSRYNIDCCGHEDENYGPKWPGVELTSAGYCNHRSDPVLACYGFDCRHPECNNPPF